MAGDRSARYASELGKLNFIIQNCEKCSGTGITKEGILSDTSVTKARLKHTERLELKIERKYRLAEASWVDERGENPLNSSYGLCQCRRKAEALRELIISDIPRSFYDLGYNDIVPREVTVVGIQTINLKKFIQWYINKFTEAKQNSIGLNLFGTYGRGKTFAIQFLATQLIKKRYTAHYIPLFLLLDSMRYADGQAFLKEVLEVDFLIVDDIGSEHKSKRGYCGEAAYLLQRRLSRHKITNFVFNDVPKIQEIADAYGSPFGSVCRERNINLNSKQKIISQASNIKFIKKFFNGI